MMSYKYQKYRRSLVVPFVNKSTPSIYIDRYTYTNADTHTETDADTDTYTYRVRAVSYTHLTLPTIYSV